MLSKKLVYLFAVISLSGWLVSSLFIVLDNRNEKQYINEKITENAFNIVHQALQDKKNDAEIVAQMQEWFEKGWTAQTASITTICDNNRRKLNQILSSDSIAIVCRLRI